MLHAGGQGGGITAATANEGWHYLERHGIQRLIMDSGAGEDIIPAENESLNAILCETQRGVKLETCNGTVRSAKVVDLLIKALGIGITAYALPKSPALLPVGKRALEDGFTHIWVGGHEPLLIKPDDSAAIPMQLRNKCPYLYEDVESICLLCGDDLYEEHGICMRDGCLCIQPGNGAQPPQFGREQTGSSLNEWALAATDDEDEEIESHVAEPKTPAETTMASLAKDPKQ